LQILLDSVAPAVFIPLGVSSLLLFQFFTTIRDETFVKISTQTGNFGFMTLKMAAVRRPGTCSRSFEQQLPNVNQH
jgi:hypothetical protein